METGKLLATVLPKERIKTRLIDLVTFAPDAGFYNLIPKAVVQPVSEAEIIALFEFSHQHNIPLTFRTGGTSLSGQAITDGILVDLSQYWNKISVEAAGALVRVQPGITGSMVNAYLKKYKRKIGPDPSSIDAAMMGGILSNNSSGMCCGVSLNSYHTTQYIRFILTDGNSFSTEQETDYKRFEKECAAVCAAIREARQEILSNQSLYELIRKKYQTKNTVGYSLNAFIDYEHPLDVFAHLLIGAEGTLGFIAEAVMKTVPDYPFKSTAFLYFPDIYAACKAITPLTNSGAQAIELMDRASLRSIENLKGVPDRLRTLPGTAAALLVEYQADSTVELQTKIDAFLLSAPSLSMLEPPRFTEIPAEQAMLWKLRKGLFPAVGAVRASGTTVILEDIAFPVEILGEAILDLQAMFIKHGYPEAIIFGHAKDGNIHFVITQAFHTPADIERYDLFLQEVVQLVVEKYDGTLKAEHGTGRNMAPFVETEWGAEAYGIMKKLKQAIDPRNLLNPGVIINEDKKAHIHHLKALPTVEEEVDKCIECGYCEHKCPSRDITMTPRRRIIARRELMNFKKAGDQSNYKLLLHQYQYDGLDTCAVDGLCATACPVDINTGDLVKRLRRENHSSFSNRIALLVAKQFKLVENMARTGLRLGVGMNSVFGKNTMKRIMHTGRKMIPSLPLWSDHFGAAPAIPATNNHQPNTEEKQVIYFPACISRLLGKQEQGKPGIMETMLSVSRKAGIKVILPTNIKGTCCGQIFSSKGFAEAYRHTANHIVDYLWKVSEEGKLAVVTDVSSCAYTFHHLRPALSAENKERFDKMTIMDSVDYLHDLVLPLSLSVQKKGDIVLHPVCSLQKMGTQQKFITIAKHFAVQVTVPVHAGCCGMAGDRGFLFPELTGSATQAEALEVQEKQYDGYYSSTRTCEIAMTEAVQQNYESILYLADKALE